MDSKCSGCDSRAVSQVLQSKALPAIRLYFQQVLSALHLLHLIHDLNLPIDTSRLLSQSLSTYVCKLKVGHLHEKTCFNKFAHRLLRTGVAAPGRRKHTSGNGNLSISDDASFAQLGTLIPYTGSTVTGGASTNRATYP